MILSSRYASGALMVGLIGVSGCSPAFVAQPEVNGARIPLGTDTLMIARGQSSASSDSVPWHRREPPAGPEWRDAGWNVATLTADSSSGGGSLQLDVQVHDSDSPSHLTARYDASSLRPISMRVETPGATMGFAFGPQSFTEIDSSAAGPPMQSSGGIPAGAYTSESLDLLVRALPLADGYRTTARLALPMLRRVETIGVRVDGRDTVAARSGRVVECWRVAVTSERAPTTWFWVARPSRQLIRIEVMASGGRVTVWSR
jgi:hypothetical protein